MKVHRKCLNKVISFDTSKYEISKPSVCTGVLDLASLTRPARMRWSLAAHDICFTNALHSCFFALGKCVPVVRGAGVHQPAMDFCVERLSRGEWVHIFPEGRVNVNKEHIRFKWGVGRLVADCSAAPLIVPVWHEGMDAVLPNTEPYLLKFRKQDELLRLRDATRALMQRAARPRASARVSNGAAPQPDRDSDL
ncbi:hypothetical protein HF086_014660 [Spodoptera exigua]|uniref:Tafazzin family protein n=1 Tax=Spodoptera exigua TaxID=7107 RepID=A0A922MT84_SPOEX|nr:hypothetical protein HF086_014660 [Spodoptera exigua]